MLAVPPVYDDYGGRNSADGGKCAAWSKDAHIV